MSPELEALASTAAAALIGALAADGWERAKSGLAALWRQAHRQQDPPIETELAITRGRLLTAREVNNRDVEKRITKDWHDRMRDLLVGDDPAIAESLRVLAREWRETAGRTEVHNTAVASGQARVFQTGTGNQFINER